MVDLSFKDAGLEFSVVFSRKQKPQRDNTEKNSDPGNLVVIRVANEIRDLLKANNDKNLLWHHYSSYHG